MELNKHEVHLYTSHTPQSVWQVPLDLFGKTPALDQTRDISVFTGVATSTATHSKMLLWARPLSSTRLLQPAHHESLVKWVVGQ